MSGFDQIRPYNDDEVKDVLDRLTRNPELVSTLVKFRFSNWPTWSHGALVWGLQKILKSRAQKIKTIRDFQLQIESYMQQMINTSTSKLTFSGVDELDLKQPCLFISNHRDIALDPAFVNWALHINGFDTVHIAIGDNLLTKDWVSDLMRLNKCFIVNRSAESKRDKLKASKELSAYIHHSLKQEQAHTWIAQKEGRAKDGNDRTNPAIISMLMLNKPKEMDFGDYLKELRIVPVAISYEFDPCDAAKAQELYQQEKEGVYEKEDHEDVKSISMGITGSKGHVHLHFGTPIVSNANGSFNSAKDVALEVDRQIHQGYHLMATNVLAAQKLKLPVEQLLKQVDLDASEFEQRLSQYPEAIQAKMLAMYAEPVRNQLALQDSQASAKPLAS